MRSLIVTAIALALSCGFTHTRPNAIDGQITVRMARPNEFRRQTSLDLNTGFESCQFDGPPAPEIFEPVVEFARANLIRAIDNFTGYASKEIEARLEDNDAHHADGFFTEVVVQPRSRLGQLEVWQREVFRGRSTWGAKIVYCIHVIRGRTTTTVVLEELHRIIG